MYLSINQNLRNYIEKTEETITHTDDMPKELEIIFEETKEKILIHDEMRDKFKGKLQKKLKQIRIFRKGKV